MVSDSVSWPVSMITGALKPPLRRSLTASRPSMIGQADIHDQKIDPALAGALDPFGRRAFLFDIELFVKRQLLDQAVAEHVVVVDYQYLRAGMMVYIVPVGE